MGSLSIRERMDMDTPASSQSSTDSGANGELGATIAKIENIFEALVDALGNRTVMHIPVRNRKSGNERRIRFPGANAVEIKRFVSLLLVLHICHGALANDYIVTKRNIYYQDPSLFGTQKYVDQLVDDIAFTFGVGRDALNIVASAKGLVSGSLLVTLNDGSIMACDNDDKGLPVPRARSVAQLDTGSASWLLVIEKEATFRTLAASQFHTTCSAGHGIFVTAKGYPDLSTRQFLRLVHQAYPHLPMLALVDYDPDGIAILGTYKYSSKGLEHEEQIDIPELLWLGPKNQDILQAATSSDVVKLPHKLLTLTHRDRRKAINMLRRLRDNHSGDAHVMGVMHELQLMLLLNVKTEIQMVDDGGHIESWLDGRLCEILSSD